MVGWSMSSEEKAAQHNLNMAVFYALRAGCFFPIPEPPNGASVDAWIAWGAMRNLHTAIAEYAKYRERIDEALNASI